MAKVSWLIPRKMGEEEFIAGIKDAEKGPFISVEESKLRFVQWLQNKSTESMFPTIIPVLREVLRDFRHETDSNFVIDLCVDNVCELQVINLQAAQQAGLLDYRRGEFGFVAYLCFDVSFSEEAVKHQKFKVLPIFDTFSQNDFQGIPCYGRNLGFDVDEVGKMLSFILMHVCDILPEQTVEASIQS